MTYRRWSAGDKQALKKLYPAYLCGEVSKDELTKVFDRPYNSVHYMAGQLKLTGKAFSTLDEELFLRLRKRFEK